MSRRFDLVADVLREVVADVIEVRAAGEGDLAQLLDLALIGDFVSLHLAGQEGIDPGPIPVLDELKRSWSQAPADAADRRHPGILAANRPTFVAARRSGLDPAVLPSRDDLVTNAGELLATRAPGNSGGRGVHSRVSCVRVCGCKSKPVAGKTTHVRQLVVAEHGAA